MITPWNFPMAIPSWKILPAIVCGNTCVIKPAQDTPLSTFNLVRTLSDAGVPNGVINIVTGFGSDVGAPAHRASRCKSHLADRFHRGGTNRRHHRGQEFQTLLAGIGRQESDDRAG